MTMIKMIKIQESKRAWIDSNSLITHSLTLIALQHISITHLLSIFFSGLDLEYETDERGSGNSKVYVARVK